MPRKQPYFDFLPRVFSQHRPVFSKDALGSTFDLLESSLASGLAVSIYAKQEQVDHAPVPAERLLDVLPLQCFARTVEPRILADPDLRREGSRLLSSSLR